MGDIQNYNMEHVDTLAPDTIKESVMCRHSQLSLLLADKEEFLMLLKVLCELPEKLMAANIIIRLK